MSASSKKKLRHAQEAEKLTEKQLAEQKEAKKLKTYTTLFVVVIALMVVFAVYTAVSTTITNSGVFERSTTALTIGEHEIDNAELNFYFIHAVNQFYSQYGAYAALFGLDVSKPLDEQVIYEETGGTWADDFLASAKSNIQAVYALNNAAAEHGFTLSEAETASLDSQLLNMASYAKLYGYESFEQYLKALYGNGATEESFRNYVTMTTLANAYQTHYAEHLSYTADDIRAKDAESPAEYSLFNYNSVYLTTSQFLTGGTEGEDGTVTYSDAEREAARAQAEAAAKSLLECTTVEELDAAIAALPINAEKENAASTAYTDTKYSSVNSVIRDWVTDASRKAGDITSIVSSTTSTAEDGTETTTVNGYYVVMFGSTYDNNYPLANVRHILVSYEGGTYDSTTGTTTYSDEEKAAAKEKAEELLATWQAGDATEDSFAELAKAESTDTGSVENGGLYEDVYPGQMVTNFDAWCFEDGRKAGDTGIVESDYGYHVMFYSSDSETLYRDFLIENVLVNEATDAWYSALIEATTVTDGEFKYLSTDLIISPAT